MASHARKLAGVKGAITRVKAMIAANKHDIMYGHSFEQELQRNEAKLAKLKRKLKHLYE